jgi:hypothetical protein
MLRLRHNAGKGDFIMRFVLIVLSALLLGLAPAHAAGGKKASKPQADGAKSGGKARQTPAESDLSDDPEMAAKLDKLGPLMAEIGVEAAMIAGGKSDGLFLYVEMKTKNATILVFRDRGKTVKLFVPTDRLRDLVKQAWLMETPDKRWAALAYEVRGRKFDTRFLYPGQADLKKPFEERLHALMPARFSGKKVVVERRKPEADQPAPEEPDADTPFTSRTSI